MAIVITPKIKEPEISEHIQDIIARSIKDTKDKNQRYDDIYRYKYAVMKELLGNQDLLKALHHYDAEIAVDEATGELNPDKFKDVLIFDYLKLPNLKSQVKNYVCFEVTELGYEGTYNRAITIRVVSHEEDIETDWGISRHDLLALIIKDMFNFNNIFGMTLRLTKDAEDVTTDGYVYRELQYKAANMNDRLNYINNHIG